LAKEPCKVQLHLSVAEETYDGFSLLPDRCKKMPVYGHQRQACTIKSHLVYIGRVIRS